MDKEIKVIEFKYVEKDDFINLGVPRSVFIEEGNWRDGGCQLKFVTSELSIGLKERFSLYLFAEDINLITSKIWEMYLKTEPKRALKDINTHIAFLEAL